MSDIKQKQITLKELQKLTEDEFAKVWDKLNGANTITNTSLGEDIDRSSLFLTLLSSVMIGVINNPHSLIANQNTPEVMQEELDHVYDVAFQALKRYESRLSAGE